MRDMTRECLALGLALAISTAVCAEPPPPQPSAAQLQEWVKQLDAEDYAVREEATRNLTAASQWSIEALAEGVTSKSPEVAWRASESLQQIAIGGDEETLNRVVAVLERLRTSGKSGLSNIAQELRSKQIKLRHDRAAGQIRSLGGKLAGGMDADLAGGFIGGGFIGGIEVMPAIAVDFGGGEIPLEVVDEIRGLEAIPAEPAEPEKPVVLKALDLALKRLGDLLPGAIEPEAPPTVVEGADDVRPEAPVAPDLPPDVPPADVAPADVAPGEEPEPPTAEAPIAEPTAEGEIAPADVVAIEVGGPVDVDLVAPVFGGGFFVEADPFPTEGGGLASSLALDQEWRGGDDGLKVLCDLPSIYHVSIVNAKMGDAALAHLAALPNLQHLDIQVTKFSAAALQKFRERRPSCRVTARGDAMLGVHADLDGSCILSGIYQGSGAAAAGLQAGDEIVSVDGHKVRDFSDLTIAVYTHAPGEKLKVEYVRDGARKTAEVTLKSRSALERARE
jgi:hypothetical protein